MPEAPYKFQNQSKIVKSLHYLARKEQAERIDSENKKILAIINFASPTIRAQELDRDYR